VPPLGRIKDYAKHGHEEICLLVQVETQAALDNIEAICAIEGIDGVFIGPPTCMHRLATPARSPIPR